MNRTKFVLSLILVLAMAFGFTAAAPAQAQSSVITVAFAQEPDNMNSLYSNMSFAKWANNLVYAGLFHYSDTLEAIPVLLEEVPTVENGGVSEDRMTYTLTLKSGLLWSDGEALDADDVVFTYEMLNDPANNFLQAQGIRDSLDTVTKVDDLTVTLEFNVPSPAPELKASAQIFTIFPEHAYRPWYEENGSIEQAPENQNPTVFSGPYMLTEWRRGEALTFTANPNYALGQPSIETVVIRVFPDPESGYAALGAGQVDMVVNLGPTDGPRVQALSPDIEVVQVFGGFIEGLYLNVRGDDLPRAGHPALQDVNVRRALRLAIDRQAIARDLLAGAAEPTDSVYDGSPFEDPNLEFVEYNLEEANRLLDEAGWVVGADGIREKDGVRLELRYGTTTAAFRSDTQAVVQQQLALAGVGIILESYPATEFFGSWADSGTTSAGEFDIAEFAQSTALTTSYNETVNDGAACAQRVSAENPGGTNNIGYCNEEMDALAKVAVESLDPAEVQDAINQIQRIWVDDVPSIILYPRGDIYAYNASRFAAPIAIGSGQGNMWFDVHNWQLQ